MRAILKPIRSIAEALRAATDAAVFAAVLATALPAALPAQAQDLRKNDWSLSFFNDSSVGVAEFRVAATGGHDGHSWLRVPMVPGHGLTMAFSEPFDTRCESMTRVVSGSRAAFEQRANYRGRAIVRVTDSGLSCD